LGLLSISHETIYRYVWTDRACGGALHTYLRQSGKQRTRGDGHHAGTPPASSGECPRRKEDRDDRVCSHRAHALARASRGLSLATAVPLCATKGRATRAGGRPSEEPREILRHTVRNANDLVRRLAVQLEVQLALRALVAPVIPGLQLGAAETLSSGRSPADRNRHARGLTIE